VNNNVDDATLISFIVHELNQRIDILGDLVSEEHEENLITPIVELVVPYIPTFIRPVLVDAADGLDDAERQRHQTSLINYLHDRIDSDMDAIPWYGRALINSTLKAVTTKIADLIFGFAQHGISLVITKDTTDES